MVLLSTLQYSFIQISHYGFSLAYPLFRSSRIVRGKECEENKEIILKYWVIRVLIYLLNYYFEWILQAYFEIGTLTVAFINVALVIMNFKISVYVYDHYISELFATNEKLLHNLFKMARKIFENTIYSWIDAVKELILALLASIIPKLPAPLRLPLDFIGVTGYL